MRPCPEGKGARGGLIMYPKDEKRKKISHFNRALSLIPEGSLGGRRKK